MGFKFKKKTIFGCDEFGSGEEPYLTRYTFWESEGLQVCLHVFHRSDDARALHDHPWPFVTWLLWTGYKEHTVSVDGKPRVRRWLPGAVLWRPAAWVHRVELYSAPCDGVAHDGFIRDLRIPCEKCGDVGSVELNAVTLVVMGRRVRDWGFHLPSGWLANAQYDAKFGCHTEENIKVGQ